MANLPLTLLALAALASVSIAATCAEGCQRTWGEYYKSEAAYKGRWGFGEFATHYCPSNENGTNQPCYGDYYACSGSSCWDAAQECCLKNLQSAVAAQKAKCMAKCPAENATAPPANATSASAYKVEILPSGTVSMTDLGGNPVSGIGNYPVSIRIGSNGKAYLVFRAENGERAFLISLEAGTDFRLDTTTCPIITPPGGSLSGSPAAASLSSEHGSCRGTINGGGDFIKGPGRQVASLAGEGHEARFAPAQASYGRIDINESTPRGYPSFELSVSLPDGNIFINSTSGNAAYRAEPYDGGVRVCVFGGTALVTSDRVSGSRSLSAGESAFLKAGDISTPIIQNGVHPPVPANTTTGDCAKASDCPGWQFCEDGECVNPSCGSAFISLGVLLATCLVRIKPGK